MMEKIEIITSYARLENYFEQAYSLAVDGELDSDRLGTDGNGEYLVMIGPLGEEVTVYRSTLDAEGVQASCFDIDIPYEVVDEEGTPHDEDYLRHFQIDEQEEIYEVIRSRRGRSNRFRPLRGGEKADILAIISGLEL